MFPLGTVLFPYAELPLQVFEPRYRMLTHDVLAGDREFGVVLIERGHEVGGGDRRFSVGTVASIVQAVELADGRTRLATVGLQRVRVEEWLDDDPYPRARVVPAPERIPDPSVAADSRMQMIAKFAELLDLVRRRDALPDEIDIPIADDPVRASFEAAALAPIGPLDAQELLEIDSVPLRLDRLGTLIAEQIDTLRHRFS